MAAAPSSLAPCSESASQRVSESASRRHAAVTAVVAATVGVGVITLIIITITIIQQKLWHFHYNIIIIIIAKISDLAVLAGFSADQR